MGRKMYSESQLNNMIDSKLEAHDAGIPTDLTFQQKPDFSVVQLERDNNAIGEGIHIKKLFGKQYIVGSGNIDLYNHHIMMQGDEGRVCCFTLVSAEHLVANRAQYLERLLGAVEKPISCTGFLRKVDGTGIGVTVLDWKGTLSTSKLYLSDGTYMNFPDAGLTGFADAVEAV